MNLHNLNRYAAAIAVWLTVGTFELLHGLAHWVVWTMGLASTVWLMQAYEAKGRNER